MFHISIKTDASDSRIFYICPKCSVQSVYFVVSPIECSNCGEILPDPDRLERSRLARYDYYANSKN